MLCSIKNNILNVSSSKVTFDKKNKLAGQNLTFPVMPASIS